MSTLTKFWKIILSHKWGLALQFVIFIGLAIALTFLGDFMVDGVVDEFEFWNNEKIAVFDRDQTETTKEFLEFLATNTQIIEIDDSPEEWVAATTFIGGDNVVMVIEIPDGFTQGLVNGYNKIPIEFISNTNATSGLIIRNQIDRYFNTLAMFHAAGFDMDVAQELTKNALYVTVGITIADVTNESFANVYTYFRFVPISLLIVIAVATGSVFMALSKQDINRRIDAAPVGYKKRMVERIGACMTFALLAWAIFIGITFLPFGNSMLEPVNLIRILNTLPLLFLGISIAYLITQLIEKRESLFTMVFTVVFLLAIPGGIMFELSFMGEQILNVARFTPLYWYTRVNKMLITDHLIDWTLVLQSFVIQLTFASAILATTMIFNKEKRAKNQ